MNCGIVRNLTLNISELLVPSVTSYKIEKILENLMLEVMKKYFLAQVIGHVTPGLKTRRQSQREVNYFTCYVSLFEPKNVIEALNDDNWVNAMHEELEQFVRNDV